MVISRTPFRLSFFGGGTDYPGWFRKEPGCVLSTTINKYCYISARYLPPWFGIKHRIVWSHIETVNSQSDILHPAIREVLPYLGFDDSKGLEIHHQGDLPARSGIGSSSAFSSGLIHALTALKGESISKPNLAARTIEFEQQVLKESVGCQDQAASTYGGLNRYNFLPTGEVECQPVLVPQSSIEALEERIMMFYLGTNRAGEQYARKTVANIDARTEILRAMRDMVPEAISILHKPERLDEFGKLLHEAWQLKKSLAEGISNPMIDRVYEAARKAGALGGKLMGAGGTGFIYFYVPPEARQAVIEALPLHLHVSIRFERLGSSIIHYDAE